MAVNAIATVTDEPRWEIFARLDDILEKLARDADHRLAWQSQFSVAPSED